MSVRNHGILLPAAMLVAMFSLIAATVVITLGRQSLQLTQFGERTQKQQLRAKAEVNRMLAGLANGDSVSDYYHESRPALEEGGTSWRSWVSPDPTNANLLHLHAEVWETDTGPPGIRASRVVRVESAKKQVNFVQTSAGLSGFRLFFREDGESTWNEIPSSSVETPGRTNFYESYDADESGGLYVAEADQDLIDFSDTNYSLRYFDPATDTWTDLASPPGDGAFVSLSVQGGRVAALTRSGDDIYFDQVSTYDRATDSWTTLPDPPNSLYDGNGSLNTAPGRIRSMDIDIDNNGNIYMRALANPMVGGISDHMTTVHKWDGTSWSTLPPPPSSLAPVGDPVVDQRLGYVNKSLTVTADGTVAFTWQTHVWGEHHKSRLLEYDGENWHSHPMPTSGTMYGDDYATNAGLDPSAATPFLTNLSSNLDGQIYVSNTFNTATLEEGSYSLLDEPPASGDNQSVYGIAAGTKPTAGADSYETLLSY